MYWNLMNDEEIRHLKLLKLKYRWGDQIIQTFCKIGSPLFNLWKFEDSDKSTRES